MNEIPENVNDFFVEFQERLRKNIMIIGNPGVGKNTLVKSICEKYDYEPIHFDGESVKSYASFLEQFKLCLQSRHIFSTKKKLVVLHELDQILGSDKTFYQKFKSFLGSVRPSKKIQIEQLRRKVPVIIISDPETAKKYLDLQKMSLVVALAEPDEDELLKLAKQRLPEYKNDSLKKIAQFAKGDYRQLNLVLDWIERKENSEENLDEILESLKQKQKDLGLYEQMSLLLSVPSGVGESLRLSQADTISIPMLFFENYPGFVKKFDDAFGVVEGLSVWDTFQKYQGYFFMDGEECSRVMGVSVPKEIVGQINLPPERIKGSVYGNKLVTTLQNKKKQTLKRNENRVKNRDDISLWNVFL